MSTKITIDNHTYQSPYYNQRPAGTKIDTIVVHYTVGNFESSIKWFTSPRDNGGQGVSTHYLVSDKNSNHIYQLVGPKLRAWHAGVSKWMGIDNLNHRSLGIEIVNPGYTPANATDRNTVVWSTYPEPQIKATAYLIKGLVKKYNINPLTNIVGHGDISPGRKVDPGPLCWQALHKELLKHKINILPNQKLVAQFEKSTVLYDTTKQEGCAALQQTLHRIGYNIQETGQHDQQTKSAVAAFQMRYRFQYNENWDIHAQASALAIAAQSTLDKIYKAPLNSLVALVDTEITNMTNSLTQAAADFITAGASNFFTETIFTDTTPAYAASLS